MKAVLELQTVQTLTLAAQGHHRYVAVLMVTMTAMVKDRLAEPVCQVSCQFIDNYKLFEGKVFGICPKLI